MCEKNGQWTRLTSMNTCVMPFSAIVLLPKRQNNSSITGVNVNQRDKGRRTPLHYYADNFQIAKLLIDAGADVNAGDCDGKTPLFEAHLDGNVCKYLIEKGCNVNLRDKKGRTPLLYYAVHHYASARDGFAENYPEVNFQIAKLLIEAGADVNGSARIGIKILSSKKLDPEIRQYLIEKGIITQN